MYVGHVLIGFEQVSPHTAQLIALPASDFVDMPR